MSGKFKEFLTFLNSTSIKEADNTLENEKQELCDFIKELDKETFTELMDVISSIMMDPFAIGDEDDHTEEIHGDDEVKDLIDKGEKPEDISDALGESKEDLIDLIERGNVSASERLAAAKAKRRDPRIKRMMKIKNAWRKKCAARNLAAHKMESGKWGCGKVDRALAVLQKKWQHNRQTSVKVD